MPRFLRWSLLFALMLALDACQGPGGTPSVPTTATDAAGPWVALRRPLAPSPSSDGGCPASPGAIVSEHFGPGLGPGPVYPVVGLVGPLSLAGVPPGEAGLFPLKILWVAAPQYPGPALVRARRLDGPGVVRFAGGSDERTAPQPELHLLDSAASPTGGWRQWPSYTLVAGPGCYAYQVDGTDFSYTVVILVTP